MRIAIASFSTAAVVLAAASLSACASLDHHDSQISDQRFHQTQIHTYPLSILRIDGSSAVVHPTPVDPGFRKSLVQGPSDGASGDGRQHEFALDVEPCTRCDLVAVKPNRLSSDFDIQLDHREPVAGCTTPPGRG